MNSSNILIGPGYVTWNSVNLRFAKGGLKAKFIKNLREVEAAEFGRIDSVQTKRRITVSGRLFSSWTNLSALFPTAAFNPTIGGKLFGTANLALVVNGADGSKLTVVNAQITKMANLFLGVSKEIFAADVEFTGLLLSGGNPSTAGDYYTYVIGQSYAAPAFPQSSFVAPVVSAAWNGTLVNSGTSFSAFQFKNGAAVDWKWDLDFEPCDVDGYGEVDAIVTGFEATCKGTPVVPIEADAASALLPAQALGLSENQNGAGDMVLTFGAHSVTLKSCFVAANDGFAWDTKNNRIGDLTWRSTVPFSGSPLTAAARAAVA
jgi:hypothetical protein